MGQINNHVVRILSSRNPLHHKTSKTCIARVSETPNNKAVKANRTQGLTVLSVWTKELSGFFGAVSSRYSPSMSLQQQNKQKWKVLVKGHIQYTCSVNGNAEQIKKRCAFKFTHACVDQALRIHCGITYDRWLSEPKRTQCEYSGPVCLRHHLSSIYKAWGKFKFHIRFSDSLVVPPLHIYSILYSFSPRFWFSIQESLAVGTCIL